MTERNVSLAINGMSCGGCVGSVKSVLGRIPGVRVLDVAIGNATVAVEGDRATDADLLQAIQKAGFTAERIP
jgi:copper chaperone